MKRVTEAKLDPAALRNAIRVPHDSGGLVVFEGHVRETPELFLDHYPGMTEKFIENLLREATERFELTLAEAVHRVGSLKTGDLIVWVACASPHRQAAFDGALYLMDHLKSSVPLWKREHEAWLEPSEEDLYKKEQWHEQ